MPYQSLLIAGSKGFAKEVFFVLEEQSQLPDVVFYDDVTLDLPDQQWGQFIILSNLDAAQAWFVQHSGVFTLGLGSPRARAAVAEKLIAAGGSLVSVISNYARIGTFAVEIGPGANIQPGVIMTEDIQLGRGVLLNLNVTIGHDVTIGNWVEMSPGVNVSGHCKIADLVTIGTNAALLPGVHVGEGAVIGAGAVVVKDVAPGSTVVGIPAKPIKK